MIVCIIKIRKYSNHILHGLLPPPSTASQNYSLRQRAHSLQLPERPTHLSDCNFLMMYKNPTRPSHCFYTTFFLCRCPRHSYWLFTVFFSFGVHSVTPYCNKMMMMVVVVMLMSFSHSPIRHFGLVRSIKSVLSSFQEYEYHNTGWR